MPDETETVCFKNHVGYMTNSTIQFNQSNYTEFLRSNRSKKQDQKESSKCSDSVSPLVVNTKTSSLLENQPYFGGLDVDFDNMPGVVRKFALQSLAREILTDRGKKKHRIGVCMRNLAFKKSHVELGYSEVHQRASYKNLAVCGSIWICPVCAAKVSEIRRQSLLAGITSHSELHYYLLTFTIGHKKQDRLSKLIDINTKAINATRSGKYWQSFKDQIGYIGTISTMEVTVNPSAAGWHPHKHVLLLTSKPASEKEIQDYFSDRYLKAVVKYGGYATESIAFDVEYAKDYQVAAEYVLKWGAMEEVTRSHLKKAGNGGYSAFQLLELAAKGETWAIEAYREFEKATKGKKLLTFSHGLKEYLGLDDLSDQEIAESEEKDTEWRLLARIDWETWKQISKKHLVGKLLNAAKFNDEKIINNFFEEHKIDFRV